MLHRVTGIAILLTLHCLSLITHASDGEEPLTGLMETIVRFADKKRINISFTSAGG